MPPGPIVIGRDARLSGPMVLRAVAAGVTARARPRGHRAGDDARHAAGGRTPEGGGRHHPHRQPQSGALECAEFLVEPRRVPRPAEGLAVKARFEQDRDLWRPSTRWPGARGGERSGVALERVLGLPHIDVAKIRARRLRVVVDGCASVGGIAVPRLPRGAGGDLRRARLRAERRVHRELEPLPEHLGALGARSRVAGRLRSGAGPRCGSRRLRGCLGHAARRGVHGRPGTKVALATERVRW